MDVLKSLKVESMPENLQDDDRLHWINARMPLAESQQIRAVGALLHILQKVRLYASLFEFGNRKAMKMAFEDCHNCIWTGDNARER